MIPVSQGELTTLKGGQVHASSSGENSGFRLEPRYALILVGLLLIAFGFFLVLMSNSSDISGGGVVFIGPFPIVFGVGPSSQFLITASLAIAVVMIILIILFRRRV